MDKYSNNKVDLYQMSDAAIITTALEEIKGSGEISVGENVNVDVDFILQILKNGKVLEPYLLKLSVRTHSITSDRAVFL